MTTNMMQNNDQKSLGYMRLPQILSIIPISKSAWYNGINDGKFPKPIKLGPRTSAWKRSDIKQLLEKFENGEF